jgi:hypothetical protein
MLEMADFDSRRGRMDSIRIAGMPVVMLALGGCMSYPPALSPAKGQNAGQQDFDARDCDHQVHSAGRSLLIGWATAWSDKEREDYVACMHARGYTPAPK